MSADPSIVSDLVFFRAVASTGSFVKASERLFVTQSAVSQRIARLESRLGVSLLRRHRNGVRLTKQGERLFQAADEALQMIDNGVAAVRASQEKHPVIISCVPSLALEWLTPKIAEFYRSRPDIEVSILAEMASVLGEEQSESYDISIRYGPNPPKFGRLAAEFPEAVFPVLSNSLLASLEAGEVETITLLHDALPWPDPKAPSEEWDIWRAHGSLPFPNPTRDVFVNLVQLCYRAAGVDMGVAMGRSLVVRRQILRGNLIRMPAIHPLNALRYYLVTRGEKLRPDVRAVLEWLEREFDADLADKLA